MDEYFCPKCGTILNNQAGFDPSCSAWTCTECGEQLMDDDTYEGDAFFGVAWYCDECGTLLNKQFGFSDSYGSWQCSECGHLNGTTEDDIINTEKNQNTTSEWSDFFSSIARDIFSDSDENSTNESYDDDDSDSDDDFDYSSIDDDEYSNAEDGYTANEAYDTTPKKANKSYSKPYAQVDKLSDSVLRKQRAKAFFFKKKKIQIGYECGDLLRRNVEYVYTALYNKAFNNIKRVPIRDVYINSPYSVGEVEQIIIGGSSFFESTDFIPYGTEIIITFHEKKLLIIPFSSGALHKQNYIEAGDRLQALGFTEIYERKIKDLTTGWLTKDGSVEKVTIGGNEGFKKNSAFVYDDKITIKTISGKKTITHTSPRQDFYSRISIRYTGRLKQQTHQS